MYSYQIKSARQRCFLFDAIEILQQCPHSSIFVCKEPLEAMKGIADRTAHSSHPNICQTLAKKRDTVQE